VDYLLIALVLAAFCVAVEAFRRRCERNLKASAEIKRQNELADSAFRGRDAELDAYAQDQQRTAFAEGYSEDVAKARAEGLYRDTVAAAYVEGCNSEVTGFNNRSHRVYPN
jgi:hypothetical protein